MRAETHLTSLSAAEAATRIHAGELSSEALVQAHVDRIALRDSTVHAWAWFDPEAALTSARKADRSEPKGVLHGVPVGIKDVIDTADMPTGYGSETYAGHRPAGDALAVARLREAGAIIMGKLVTAEFATYCPGPTTNPINPAHTPGGSSSGSAAAVADQQIPLSLGTQTAGSVIRPASFCGIFGFKPTFGRYPTAGVLETSPRLDTLGVFARSVDDLLLVDAVLAPDAVAEQGRSDRPKVGVYRSDVWDQASPSMRAALDDSADWLHALGYDVFEIAVPYPFDRLVEAQTIIHKREAWICMGQMRKERGDRVSQAFRDFIDSGEAVDAETYAEACQVQEKCRAAEAKLFAGADLLLSPGAPGIAPEGLSATGNPVFNRMTTALGVPCFGFPVSSERRLPLGLQLIGRRGADRTLLQLGAGIVAMLQ